MIDEERMEEDDPYRFQEARSGDHLMVPFQCDLCHFMNLKARPPIEGFEKDALLLLCIRRAVLDSLWARERSTVRSNLLEAKRFVAMSELVGLENPYPPRGPWQVKDEFGMMIAVPILLRSLDPGKHSNTIQFETVRKMRSHISNFTHTLPGGVGTATTRSDGVELVPSNSPTNSLWFRRFMLGCHRRMGDIWIPDRPILVQELKMAFQILEDDWARQEKDQEARLVTALTAVIFLSGFFAALRGEEIVRIDVGGLREHWQEAVNWVGAPHVPLMLAGRFKGETGEKVFCQPLAMVSKSGISLALWMFRALEYLHRAGVTSGPMFRSVAKSKSKAYRRASVADLDVKFHKVLERIQERWPTLIPDSVDVKEEYSCSRSLRRGATSEAQNRKVPKEVIDANNRWRKHARAKGLVPGMSMLERYSDAKASVPTLIRFSESL